MLKHLLKNYKTIALNSSDDFGYYSQLIPGCFYRLGTGNIKKGITSGVHTPTFNIDENAIEIGMGIMAWLGSSLNFS